MTAPMVPRAWLLAGSRQASSRGLNVLGAKQKGFVKRLPDILGRARVEDVVTTLLRLVQLLHKAQSPITGRVGAGLGRQHKHCVSACWAPSVARSKPCIAY